MDNVTVKSLEKAFPGEGEKRFKELCARGGFGDVPADYEGGLDIRGVIDPSNSAISDSEKSKIADLAGVSKEDRKRIESGETTGTPDKKTAKKEK